MVQEVDATLPVRILPLLVGDGKFAVIPQRFSVAQDVVPDEAAGGIGQGIHIVILHPIRITPGESGERFLHVIGRKCRGGPLVAIRTKHPAAVGIVEQGEFPDQLVLVGGDPVAENAQGGVSVPGWHIPQHLVIGAVLLHEINHMLEHARLPRPLRHRAGRLTGPWLQRRCLEPRVMHVPQCHPGVLLQSRTAWNRHD